MPVFGRVHEFVDKSNLLPRPFSKVENRTDPVYKYNKSPSARIVIVLINTTVRMLYNNNKRQVSHDNSRHCFNTMQDVNTSFQSSNVDPIGAMPLPYLCILYRLKHRKRKSEV